MTSFNSSTSHDYNTWMNGYASTPEEETCNCYEIMGDNPNCPKHGDMFTEHGAFSDAEIKADYQERNELYNMGMGA